MLYQISYILYEISNIIYKIHILCKIDIYYISNTGFEISNI